jgi:carboxyl-terminal processing protease
MVGDRIGYIRLTQFTQDAGKNVADALRQLKDDAANSLKDDAANSVSPPGESASGESELRGVVLDLRGNPGGLLREAVNVSNVFIPKGELIVSTQGKVKEWDRDFKTLNQPVDTEIPVVVLTSRASASASEIVAGVIQDYDRGLVVGARSFGKGLVQSTRDVPYKTKLKVTTAKYYTPSGRCIQAIDYAHRNDDGSVGKIADSLKTPFKTRAGRTVYDGGGVMPDVKTDMGEYADITIALMRKNHFFKYATKFRAEHDSIGPAMAWSLSDADWADFKAYVDGVDVEYTTGTEDLLEELRESAEDEMYLEAIAAELETLEEKLGHDKKSDVEQFAEEIRHELETEIVGRYYLQRGAIEASFRYDTDLEAALALFDDAEQYSALLDPSVVVGREDDMEDADQ